MKFYILMSIAVSGLYGFLLDHSQPPAGGNLNGQFISNAEFLTETKELQHTIDLLRHDTEKTFALLTSQLDTKLSDLGSQVLNVKNLEANNSILQRKLDTVLRKLSNQEYGMTTLQNRTNELENENVILKREISSLENITQQQRKEILDLQQLKNIQGILDVKLLQQQIRSLTTETHALSINEQARRQDFIALYDKTDQEFRSLYNKTLSLESKTTSHATAIDNQLNMTSSQLNNSIYSLKTDLDTTKKSFDKKMETATEKVVITSCVTTQKTWSGGEILKFDEIVTQAGISNIDSFRTSGKFTCSVPGLYHISVYVISYTNGAQYAIYKNNNVVSRVYIADHSSNMDHTGTGVVTLLLQTGDSVWIQTRTSMEVYHSRYSCLSIVKLK